MQWGWLPVLNYLSGKILRIDVNQLPYAIPADSHFIGVKQARSEVWAYGFRKVWRFSFDPVTKKMFDADCGELEEEDIVLVIKGGNYGWPVMEGNRHFNKTDSVHHAGFIAPNNSYSHKEGLCIIGGFIYNGNDLPLLKGNYVFADFNGSIYALMKNDKGDWARKQLKILNKPAGQFMICGVNEDYKNEIYVMGILVTQTGGHGVVYKVVQARV